MAKQWLVCQKNYTKEQYYEQLPGKMEIYL